MESDRFWSKVQKTETCWLWTGALNGGYGHFRAAGSPRGKMVYAHRWAYQALVGAIPEGLSLDHRCSTKSCVNPAHLEPVTHAVNVQRACLREISACGHPLVTYGGKRYCKPCRRAYLNEYQRQRRRAEGAMVGGPGVVNATKTHCKRGHEFTEENTRRDKDGHRTCRACRRESRREQRRNAQA